MRTKPRLILVDASVIITAYSLGVWDALLQKVDIAVSSTIAHDEALFYEREAGCVPLTIDIPLLVGEGKIIELAANVTQIARVRGFFDLDLNMTLHGGEVEALALLYADDGESLLFCTSDKAAIWVLAMLGLSERGISFEDVLAGAGLGRSLPGEYGAAYFKRNIALGQTMRIQGRGVPYA